MIFLRMAPSDLDWALSSLIRASSLSRCDAVTFIVEKPGTAVSPKLIWPTEDPRRLCDEALDDLTFSIELMFFSGKDDEDAGFSKREAVSLVKELFFR